MDISTAQLDLFRPTVVRRMGKDCIPLLDDKTIQRMRRQGMKRLFIMECSAIDYLIWTGKGQTPPWVTEFKNHGGDINKLEVILS